MSEERGLDTLQHNAYTATGGVSSPLYTVVIILQYESKRYAIFYHYFMLLKNDLVL